MKLFRIIVLHGGPKDSHTSTETYLTEKDDEAVAKWIDKKKCHGYWFSEEDADGGYENKSGQSITFREYVMEHCGDLSDESGWEDSYYGVTKWGWEEVAGATDADIARLVDLGIAVKA